MISRATLLTAAAWLFCSGVVQAREAWTVLKDCRLLRNESADADSFHVNAQGKEYIFRLYFVDAPETDMSFADRVGEQAKYFGLTPEQTITLGEHAKRFTREKLGQPFTVRTCMQDAMGRSKMDRYYAFVETKEGDLAELLVSNGLARLHGAAARPVGLRSPERMWDKLERLEREAKQLKVGAWGARAGRMTARAPATQAKTGPSSFDAFFHPDRVVEPAAAAAASASPNASALGTIAPATAVRTAPGAPDTKLDINAAASEELLKISGIGPVLAQRIISARPFKSADDLASVKGIGPKKYEQIRPYFQ